MASSEPEVMGWLQNIARAVEPQVMEVSVLKLNWFRVFP